MAKLGQDMEQYGEGAKYLLDNEVGQRAYASRVIDLVGGTERCATMRALDLGIGHGITTEAFSGAFGTYHVLDGSPEMIKLFWSKRDRSSFNGEVFETYFEDFEPDCDYDVIVMGFILEHVEDPLGLLRKFGDYLKPDGRMFLAVPNALAMHRRLGHHAGLLDDMYALSETDLALGHRRFFDHESLKALIEEAGFSVAGLEGIFLKPITTGQIQALGLGPNILQAMVTLGIDYPELSNSVLAEVRRT